MIRVVEMKLYLTSAQQATLESWLRTCCWLYNRCLEQRIKVYKRRGEAIGYNRQCEFITGLRERMPNLKAVPVEFERDALRRVDHGMQAFFRRCKAGQKAGFPRFRARTRYNSLEYLKTDSYVRPGNLLSVPKLGLATFRARDQRIVGTEGQEATEEGVILLTCGCVRAARRPATRQRIRARSVSRRSKRSC
jgi:putative transposase